MYLNISLNGIKLFPNDEKSVAVTRLNNNIIYVINTRFIISLYISIFLCLLIDIDILSPIVVSKQSSITGHRSITIFIAAVGINYSHLPHSIRIY